MSKKKRPIYMGDPCPGCGSGMPCDCPTCWACGKSVPDNQTMSDHDKECPERDNVVYLEKKK